MNRRTLAHIFGIERRLTWFFLMSSCALVGLYVYFLTSSVASIVLRQEAALNMRSISSQVSSLEADYFAQKEKITPELAQSLGFIPVTEKSFITRTDSGLSFAGNRAPR